MKVLQTNLNRQKSAHDMAYLIAARETADIIVVSEPNRKIVQDTKWITDKNMDVAVYFQNRNLAVKSVNRECGFVGIKFELFNIYCCYCSPNISINDFKAYVDILMNTVRSQPGEAVIMGDMNIKSPRWGSPVADSRGEYFTEWTDVLDLVIHNKGSKPTFIRGPSQSFIDITCSTQGVAENIHNWAVLEDEPISDHSFILFEITDRTQRKQRKTEKEKLFLREDVFRQKLTGRLGTVDKTRVVSIEECMKILKSTYTLSCINRGSTRNVKVPYWWNQEIEVKRRECISARRNLTRHNARHLQNNIQHQDLAQEYKVKKRELKKLISRSKKRHWKDLCEELDNNPWGNGYKIAVMHLKNPTMPYNLPNERKIEIVEGLFPLRSDQWTRGEVIKNVERFTREELTVAKNAMKNGKAPGPDNVPPEAVKMFTEISPEFVLAVFNNLLREQVFPDRWKMARVCLLLKSGKSMESSSAFRPICLLDTMSKLFEALIRGRLEKEVAANGGLSEDQFGFVKGKSTIQAVESVLKAVRQSEEKWCTLVTLDIRNAFNTATWSIIIQKLKELNIPGYLVNMIESYFQNRTLKIAGTERRMSCGVPQGSVLGPTLWNILYDGILRQDLGDKVRTICFADDLAVLVEAEDATFLSLRVNEALWRINRWLQHHKLDLAPEKTEAVILKGGRHRRNITFKINGVTIAPSQSVKYLGIILSSNGTFTEHFNAVVTKAEQRTTSFSQLMPNLGGPQECKRRVLSGVVHSILLYGAPVWYAAMNTSKHRDKLTKAQRKILLRVARSYRTASTKALQVITGIIPIDLQAVERGNIYEAEGAKIEIKKKERQRTLDLWQQRWDDEHEKAQWTKRLIPRIQPWLECKHRNTDYFMTQALTGHGSFHTYLQSIGAAASDECIYCRERDTPEHTLFHCEKWNTLRQETYLTLGHQLNPDNLTVHLTESKHKWHIIQMLIQRIMRQKEKDRNERQNN